MSSVITKHGDNGMTEIISGKKKISKGSYLICLIGDLDEINANIGYLLSILHEKQYILGIKAGVLTTLEWTQDGLYNLGVEISSEFNKIFIGPREVNRIESETKEMEEVIPFQRHFIHYRGVKAATYTHVVRTVVRRCERDYIKYISSINFNQDEYPYSYQFINRLSDYLFVLSRYLNYKFGGKETKVVKWDHKNVN